MHATLAQLVEQEPEEFCVVSSILTGGTNINSKQHRVNKKAEVPRKV